MAKRAFKIETYGLRDLGYIQFSIGQHYFMDCFNGFGYSDLNCASGTLVVTRAGAITVIFSEP